MNIYESTWPHIQQETVCLHCALKPFSPRFYSSATNGPLPFWKKKTLEPNSPARFLYNPVQGLTKTRAELTHGGKNSSDSLLSLWLLKRRFCLEARHQELLTIEQ